MFSQFGLTLMVNHACNLRCTYCYTGAKLRKALPDHFGRKAIDRAYASLFPQGTLELGFFGGEPLLEAHSILAWITYAMAEGKEQNKKASFHLTTNGTLFSETAWKVLLHPEVDVAVSCDGLPEIHDRHRLGIESQKTSALVLQTLHRLLEEQKTFRVVMVIRPDTVAFAEEGVRFLKSQGVSSIDFSLDLWASWTAEDLTTLTDSIKACATLWGESFPSLRLNWFDEKFVELAQIPVQSCSRCGFGQGEVALAPSGNLYPCERLIGEDRGDLQLEGHVLDGHDFLSLHPSKKRDHDACDSCCLNELCNTFCRCSNYVRTGKVNTPDRLLCHLNQVCTQETARVLNSLPFRPLSLATS